MSGLSPKQLQALSGIARGLSPSAIAKEINVSERTVQRWVKLPQFQEALNQLQTQTKSKILEKVSEVTSERFTLDMRELSSGFLRLAGLTVGLSCPGWVGCVGSAGSGR